MYLFKNAMKNIGRNKGRNIIVGIVMVSVLALSSISLVINATSDKIKETYKETFGSEVYVQMDIDKMMASGDLEFGFEELSNQHAEKLKQSEYLKETRVIYTMPGVSSTSKPIEVENDSDQSGNMMMVGGSSADFRISAYSDMKFMSDFEDGSRKLVEGRIAEGKNEALVSKDFADLNSLKVGDTFKVGYSEDKSEMELTIVGLFFDTATDNHGFIPFAEMNPKNEIIVSEDTLLEYTGSNEAWAHRFYTFYLKNPDLLEAFNDYAYEIGMSDTLMMTTNTGAYQQMVGPLEGIAKTSMNMLWLILIFGSGLVVLMSVLSVRERKYEVGVLRAIGMKKKQLIKTFLYESLIIMITCLVIGMGIGGLMAKPVSAMMLEQQNSMPQGGVIGSVSVVGGDPQEFEIGEVEFSSKAMMQVSAVGLLIALVSTSVGVIYVLRYEPMEILSERN